MFGLFATKVIFNKQVKVVDFSALDRTVTVKLSNKKIVKADVTVTSPEQFSDQLIQAGLNLFGLPSAIKRYKDYVNFYNDLEDADDDMESDNAHHTETADKTFGDAIELTLRGYEDEKKDKIRELSLVLSKIVAEKTKVISPNSFNSDYNKNDGYGNFAKEEKLVADCSQMSDEHLRNKKLKQLYAKIENLGK